MSPSTPPSQPTPKTATETSLLGQFASVLGLLGASLYFTGWIYRWAYFAFFQVEVTTLDLPVESFLLVPLQVFFGDGHAMFRTFIAAVVDLVAIYVILWGVESGGKWLGDRFDRWCKRNKTSPFRWLRSFAKFNDDKFNQFSSVTLLQSLVDEAIVILVTLTLLFYLASTQGEQDAKRDAYNKTSLLPVVTLITPENRLALGQQLTETETAIPSQNYRLIGDAGLFNYLNGKELTTTGTVWRLLIEQGGWIYLFQALPENAPKAAQPLLLAIQEGELGEQLMILSPQPTYEVQIN
ncbi:hypothetical protein PN462_14765 [Spirulina sp. CS-785/01]|uniref:hypothetical protein n=1 Tax=Spirulina sp. CS-785/01 TaxID=3021716 RepID=UPI00232DE783|nr:hypothetical protein [Spirulina sp. CS-785/01]MDB9314371.1 hypothetical protein [Spirulina sp. CS-785/01]